MIISKIQFTGKEKELVVLENGKSIHNGKKHFKLKIEKGI